MEPSKFDEFTKALSTSTSRRQALRRIGGTLTGAILASWPLGRALASNSAKTCASFCTSVFGAGTTAAKQCIVDASHHTGLCYQCGSASPASICCTRNASGHCSSYSSTHCPCPSGNVCQNGTCCTANGGTCSGNGDCCSDNCSNGVCCASGQVGLSNGSCATPCSSPYALCSGSSCEPNACCACAPDISGANYCGEIFTPPSGPCSDDSNCNKGYFCYFDFCIPLC